MTAGVERWAWRICALGPPAVIVAVVLAGQWNFLVGSVAGSPATTRYAPCLPGVEIPIMDSPHVSPTELDNVVYNSLPPTSGPHFAFTPASGIYTGPVSEGLTVHAMEHGHIVIQYAPTAAGGTIADLRRLAKRYSMDVLLAPYPKLASGIALTAWGRVDLLDRYDEARTVTFIERLHGRYVHGWTRAVDCP